MQLCASLVCFDSLLKGHMNIVFRNVMGKEGGGGGGVENPIGNYGPCGVDTFLNP